MSPVGTDVVLVCLQSGLVNVLVRLLIQERARHLTREVSGRMCFQMLSIVASWVWARDGSAETGASELGHSCLESWLVITVQYEAVVCL